MKGHLIFRLLAPALFVCVGVFTTNHLSAQCLTGDCQNGTGTFRYPNSNKYSGHFINGKRDGQGTMDYSASVRYVGQWKNGQRQGRGKMLYGNGDSYDGQFSQDKRQGDGVITYANGQKYSGKWANDQPHGRGTWYFPTRERYEGDLVAGRFEGQGTMYYPDGAYYMGGWKNNSKHGQGKLVEPNGNVTAGTWSYGKATVVSNTASTKPSSSDKPANKPSVNGLRNCNNAYCGNGRGYYDYPDGSRWVGEFKNGVPAGKGTCYYASGDRYEGEWNGGAPYGEGIMYFASGRVYGAVWVNGAPVRELDSNEGMPDEPVKVESSKNVKIYAVVVGVGHYTAMPSLQFTDDDAYRMNAFLRSPEGGALPDEQIEVLVDEAATRENILRTMRRLFLKADYNDVVMLYFSGHGLEGCFLPVDYDGYNNKLRHEEIKEVFKASKAKHKICIADACHSGTLNYGLAAKGAPSPVSLDRYYRAFEEADGGIALLMSSKAEELSLEDHGLRQGVFTYYVLQGLKGKADLDGNYIVTIKELYNYVYARVRDYTAGAQTPVLTGTYDNNMPVALRRY